MANPDKMNSSRFHKPVATTNLVEVEHDFPEVEASEKGAAPRTDSTYQRVVEVDLLKKENKKVHRTTMYDNEKLVIRRGQAFNVRVEFSQEVSSENIQMEFLIGTSPTPMDHSLVVVSFGWGAQQHSDWKGAVLWQRGALLELLVEPGPRAIVGRYRCYVALKTPTGTVRSRRNSDNDLYLLFNPWCQEDAAYYPWPQDLQEYVLNEHGVIFCGTEDVLIPKDWLYGQFAEGVLDACIYILDASHMPISKRCDLLCVIRKASAMLNAQDEAGVMVGNWSANYDLGTSPMHWEGSTHILREYASTGVPVRFAQCWVFAGVFTTFLRCLGIPSRTITNFNSAHDNTGNLKVDLILKPDGSLDREITRDSMWNFHCWNEAYMKRVDLPKEFSGWQAVDATPQETSDGLYRCGPAPLAAIKSGQICFGYDCGFIFAEVNSDIVYHAYYEGAYRVYKVDKTYIGRRICTKAVGSNGWMDLTEEYKYSEGTVLNQLAMDVAEGYGMDREHIEFPEVEHLRVVIVANVVYLGETVNMMLKIINLTAQDREFHGDLDVSAIHYTGIGADRPFYQQALSARVPANGVWLSSHPLPPQLYLQYSSRVHTLRVVVLGSVEQQSVTETKLIELQLRRPTVEVLGAFTVDSLVTLSATFTNDSGVPLHNVDLGLSGSFFPRETLHFDTVDIDQTITEKIQRKLVRSGHCIVIAKVTINAYESTQTKEFDVDD